MKKKVDPRKPQKKLLQLDRQTIKPLQDDQLQQVDGAGLSWPTVRPTRGD